MLDSLALYIHLPFCSSKCFYCDFNSVIASQEIRDKYLKCLIREMRFYARHPQVQNRPIASIYWGGGTPTLFNIAELSLLAEEIKCNFIIPKGVEWTVEANPGTIDYHKLCELQQAGVNRISLGVQSFDDTLLRTVNRSHTSQEAMAAVELLDRCGISNFNLDLIFGLPGQTIVSYESSLLQAVNMQPQHLSLYGLQVEDGTILEQMIASGDLVLPDEDEELTMFGYGEEILGSAGFHHYEISNYSQAGMECQHNLAYWEHREYLGLGAGAYSYLHKMRFGHPSSPWEYISLWQEKDEPTLIDCEEITPQLEEAESLMLGFRLMKGIDTRCFAKRFGTSFEGKYGGIVASLVQEGLLVRKGNLLQPTKQGQALNNRIGSAFMVDAHEQR